MIFSEPGKVDTEGSVNLNYYFNVALGWFACLTGRSLSTFRRDFEKISNVKPSRRILQKRLPEAHYLIQEKGSTASGM